MNLIHNHDITVFEVTTSSLYSSSFANYTSKLHNLTRDAVEFAQFIGHSDYDGTLAARVCSRIPKGLLDDDQLFHLRAALIAQQCRRVIVLRLHPLHAKEWVIEYCKPRIPTMFNAPAHLLPQLIAHIAFPEPSSFLFWEHRPARKVDQTWFEGPQPLAIPAMYTESTLLEYDEELDTIFDDDDIDVDHQESSTEQHLTQKICHATICSSERLVYETVTFIEPAPVFVEYPQYTTVPSLASESVCIKLTDTELSEDAIQDIQLPVMRHALNGIVHILNRVRAMFSEKTYIRIQLTFPKLQCYMFLIRGNPRNISAPIHRKVRCRRRYG